MIDEYWEAVRNNNVAKVATLLNESPSLAEERLAGEAQSPGNVYSFTENKQVPAPAGFQFTNTALHTAAEHHAPDKVELLLAHGAQHDIFTAAIVGDVELVQRMLSADPTLRDARSAKRGRTPQEEAAHHERSEVVGLF